MTRFLLPFKEGHSTPSRLSPAGKLVFALLLAMRLSIETELSLVLFTLFVTIVVACAVKTRWRAVVPLVFRFELVVLFWVLILPLYYGETVLLVFLLGPWPISIYSEGLTLGVLLSTRIFTVLLVFVVTFSHICLSEFLAALRTLRVPTILLGSLMIMLRYLPLFLEERTRMQEAQLLRGLEHGPRRRRMESLGSLVGKSIVRALDRSVIVYEAMLLRGFGGTLRIQGSGFHRGDCVSAIALVLFVLSLQTAIPVLLEAVSI
jgi:cobalt/nickel transport system permease protein